MPISSKFSNGIRMKVNKLMRGHTKKIRKKEDLESKIEELERKLEELKKEYGIDSDKREEQKEEEKGGREEKEEEIKEEKKDNIRKKAKVPGASPGAINNISTTSSSSEQVAISTFTFRFLTLAIAFFISGLWGSTFTTLLNRYFDYENAPFLTIIIILLVITLTFIFFVWWLSMEWVKNAF